jgi:acyl-CoA reductase-like NAD-dependent aldehyde dehydrogenase
MSSKNGNGNKLDIAALRAPMQATHDSGINGSLAWRIQQLEKMQRMLYEHWDEFLQALYIDLGKNRTEAAGTELSLLEREIGYFIGNLKQLMATRKVASPGVGLPAFSTITPRPKTGLERPACLVIGPSNYPLALSLQPVAGSLAAVSITYRVTKSAGYLYELSRLTLFSLSLSICRATQLSSNRANWRVPPVL